MTRTISNNDNMIDSRDVIARIEELSADRAELDEDDAAELQSLLDLASEAEGYAPDWQHGATLIRDSYFVDYCQELCADIGDLPRDLPGYLVIDWEATARNLEMDYTTVSYGGVAYLIR